MVDYLLIREIERLIRYLIFMNNCVLKDVVFFFIFKKYL
jgi:hypothetical protein